MRLYIDKQDGDAVIGVRWCISPEERSHIRSSGAKHPFLLLVVAARRNGYLSEEERQLIPLENMMGVVSFKRPGLYRLLATVVWSEDDKVRGLKSRFLKKEERGNYECLVINHDGWGKNVLYATKDPAISAGFAELDVEVDPAFFAKKPWDWRWLNFIIDTPPRNQCDARRRRIFAYFVQPFLLLFLGTLFYLINMIATTCLLLVGIRHINWSSFLLFHRGFAWEDRGKNFFLYNSKGKHRPLYFLPLMPVFWLLATAAFALPMIIAGLPIPWLMVIVKTAAFVICWSTAIALLYATIHLIDKSTKKLGIAPKLNELPQRVKSRLAGYAEEARREEIAEYDRRLDALLCDNVPEEISVATLPGRRRTIRLRFLNFKRQVCRPIAQ